MKVVAACEPELRAACVVLEMPIQAVALITVLAHPEVGKDLSQTS